jgi:hypothetical protein
MADGEIFVVPPDGVDIGGGGADENIAPAGAAAAGGDGLTDCGDCDLDKVKLFTEQRVGGADGKKNMARNCKELVGRSIPLKKSGALLPNYSVDKLFACVNPAIFSWKDGAVFLKIKADIMAGFIKGDVKGKNQKIEPAPTGEMRVIVLRAKKHGICKEGKFVLDGGTIGDGNIATSDKWLPGGTADRGAMLVALAKTIGRYWIMSGGGAGGGGGLITERQHRLRVYDPPHGSINWYDKRTSVRNVSGISALYEQLFGDQLKEWELEGGIEIDEFDEEGNPIKVEAKDLSISQFLQLASRSKALQKEGKEDELQKEVEDAFKNGEGMEREDLQKEAEKAAENCKKHEPKGLVIWDSDEKEFELPLASKVLASMAAGVEPHNDELGSDVVKYATMQLEMGMIMDPTAKGACGDPDEVDQAIDEFKFHEDLEHIGEKRVKLIDYMEKMPRYHADSCWSFPPCGIDAYRFDVADADVSGQVLWREIDCWGQIKPWDEPLSGRDKGDIKNAVCTKANDLYKIKTDPQDTVSVSTCGGGAANMPSVSAGLQSFQVTLEQDGSVSTNFTVSSKSRHQSDSKVNRWNFGGGQGIVNGGPRKGQFEQWRDGMGGNK